MALRDGNDKIAELLKQACPPAAASPEFKANLRLQVNQQAVALAATPPKPLWHQPFVWIPAAAASLAAVALIVFFAAFHSVSPAVTTTNATGIRTTAATLNGRLNSLGGSESVEVSFEWGTTTDYGTETIPELRTETGDIFSDISDLSPNTTYHFRLKVVGDKGTSYGPDMQFTTGPAPPVAVTHDAVKVDTTSATLIASLDDMGSAASVMVSFEWGLTPSYGNETAPESMSGTGKYSSDLSGLAPGTTYYYRAKADGDGDPVYGDHKSFTTSTTAPSVATKDATEVGATSATVNGDLTSLGTANIVNVSFEYGTAPGSYSHTTASQARAGIGGFSADLNGLNPGTAYYYRARAGGHGDPAYGTEGNFTTSTLPPSVETNDASNVATASATLNGYLGALGTADIVNVSFEYGTATGSYTRSTAGQARTGVGVFSADLSGLDPGTAYYFRAKADGDGDPVYGLEQAFTTLTTPPAVKTSSATEVHCTSAILNGILDNLGTAGGVEVSFEWGLNTAYGQETARETITATGNFKASLTGLIPTTTYHFRAKAVGDGVVYGDDMMFTTGSTPPAQETWYLSKDASGSVKVMYDGDASKPTGIVTLYSSGSSSSQVWVADQPPGAGTVYPAGIWDVRLLVSHVRSTHTIWVEIGTWDGIDDFVPHGNHAFLGQGRDDSIVYEYEDSISADPFDVPSGSYVATRITVSAGHMIHVHVGGSQSYVISPAYPEPTAPSVTTKAPTGVEQTTATLNGYLDDPGSAGSVTVYFEWGTTAAFGNQVEVGARTSDGGFTFALGGLAPNTTYHFRAKVVGDGANHGIDVTFTTAP